RRQADADGVEIRDHICHFEWARTKQGAPPLSSAVTSPLTALETVVSRWPLVFGRSSLTKSLACGSKSKNRRPCFFDLQICISNLRSKVVGQRLAANDQRQFHQSAAALAVGFFSEALINSTSRHRDCNSRISTLNDSGTPGSMAASPLTMASSILVRPYTSSDFAVRSSCRMKAAPYASRAQTSISPKRCPPNCALPPRGCWVISEYGPIERAWILSSTKCDSFSM